MKARSGDVNPLHVNLTSELIQAGCFPYWKLRNLRSAPGWIYWNGPSNHLPSVTHLVKLEGPKTRVLGHQKVGFWKGNPRKLHWNLGWRNIIRLILESNVLTLRKWNVSTKTTIIHLGIPDTLFSLRNHTKIAKTLAFMATSKTHHFNCVFGATNSRNWNFSAWDQSLHRRVWARKSRYKLCGERSTERDTKT